MTHHHVFSTTVRGGKVWAYVPDGGYGLKAALDRIQADDPAWKDEAIYHGVVDLDQNKLTFEFKAGKKSSEAKVENEKLNFREFCVERFGAFPPKVKGEPAQRFFDRLANLNADYMDYLSGAERSSAARGAEMLNYDRSTWEVTN